MIAWFRTDVHLFSARIMALAGAVKEGNPMDHEEHGSQDLWPRLAIAAVLLAVSAAAASAGGAALRLREGRAVPDGDPGRTSAC